MADRQDFIGFLRALETVFAAEGRPGGIEAAKALGEVLATGFALPPPNSLDTTGPLDIVGEVTEALRLGDHPAAPATLAAWPLIDWHHSGLADGRIRPEIALSMATTEVIGPNGMIFHPSVRVGLFMQVAGLDYVTRTHPAEETFVMLGGAGYWSCDGAEPTRRETGAIIHHPSGAPHVSVTRREPLIAAWRWTGDIAYAGYSLDG